nr:retrotransposon protein, putative, Ty3-gypsy subclass [Tanacetum cinerariifolium]
RGVTIPVWKWERITIDFVSGLPRTPSGYDTICVIVDRMTKLAHFMPMKKMDSMEKLMRLYLKEIDRHLPLVEFLYNNSYHPSIKAVPSEALYERPFKILAKVGPVAYTFELPEELKGIHSTFHVSNLKKCLVEGDIVVPVDEIQLDDMVG